MLESSNVKVGCHLDVIQNYNIPEICCVIMKPSKHNVRGGDPGIVQKATVCNTAWTYVYMHIYMYI